MTAVYKFFDFGTNFIKLMDGIGTGRNASLIWEDGSKSKNFELKSGRAQGDGPSPLQYNFAEQILLFKIELDPVIRPALSLAVEAGRIPAPLPWFEFETNKATKKVEALADDTTVIIDCCEVSFFALHRVLIDFEQISGLGCNFDKTCVIPIGGIDHMPFNIEHTKIKVTDSVKLLGLDLDKNLNCLSMVHDKTYEKISNIVTFWSRFWLSLPGRINIIKTLCLSQINYLGCIISPTATQLKNIEDVLIKFARGNSNIAKDRLYAKPAEGGLGLINVSAFLCAQQTLWIKKLLYAACDNWRENVYHLTIGNPLVLHPNLVDKSLNPIIFNIADSFTKFKQNYYSKNDNFKKAPVFLNPILNRGRGDPNLLDLNFFNQRPPLNLVGIARCRFNNVYTNAPLHLEQINGNRDLNLNLNLNTYFRLVAACSNHARSLKPNRVTDGTSLDLGDFFKTFKKGSKSIRKIMADRGPVDTYKIKSLVSFSRIVDINIQRVEITLLKQQLNLWTYPMKGVAAGPVKKALR
jgi:hypothetical protein